MTIARQPIVSLNLRTVALASMLVGAASLLGGCSSSSKSASKAMNSSSSPASEQMTLDMIDGSTAYQHLSLVRGQKFTVRLPTHCGSHYNWRLSPESADNNYVSLQDRRSQQVEPGESDLRDSPSCDEFTFIARRTGEVELQFIYDRPFMPEEQASREFAMNVDISKVTKESKPQLAQHASVTVD